MWRFRDLIEFHCENCLTLPGDTRYSCAVFHYATSPYTYKRSKSGFDSDQIFPLFSHILIFNYFMLFFTLKKENSISFIHQFLISSNILPRRPKFSWAQSLYTIFKFDLEYSQLMVRNSKVSKGLPCRNSTLFFRILLGFSFPVLCTYY